MRVEATALVKRYGRVAALRGVDLDVPAGGRVALVGPNGSGKSTLAKALIGLVRCEGSVLLDGVSPWTEREKVAPRLAYVPQVAPRLGVPVRELVRAVESTRALPAGRVAEVGRRLDIDLEALGSRLFRDLSGGMRQKALLACALSSGASLMLLDEPTASLDVDAREMFFRAHAELAGEATLLLCSHRPDEIARLTERVVALDEGRLAHEGPVGPWLAAHEEAAAPPRTRVASEAPCA